MSHQMNKVLQSLERNERDPSPSTTVETSVKRDDIDDDEIVADIDIERTGTKEKSRQTSYGITFEKQKRIKSKTNCVRYVSYFDLFHCKLFTPYNCQGYPHRRCWTKVDNIRGCTGSL